MPDRIVAIGLLTQHDLDVLGTGFKRLFPVDGEGAFADLLQQLDGIDAQGTDGHAAGSAVMEPSGQRNVLHPKL